METPWLPFNYWGYTVGLLSFDFYFFPLSPLVALTELLERYKNEEAAWSGKARQTSFTLKTCPTLALTTWACVRAQRAPARQLVLFIPPGGRGASSSPNSQLPGPESSRIRLLGADQKGRLPAPPRQTCCVRTSISRDPWCHPCSVEFENCPPLSWSN